MSISILRIPDLLEMMREDSAQVRIVDARPPPEYGSEHIPGAVSMHYDAWCAPGPAHLHPITAQPGYWGLLAEREPGWYGERFATLGLCHDGPIVVYADGARSRGREGRIAWMLLYLGAREVYLLNGGWSGWLAAGGPVETVAAPRQPGRFVAAFQEERRCRMADLKRAYQAGSLPLPVDTREEPDYAGEQHPYMPRMGRLPGAVLLPYPELFEADGRYRDRVTYLACLPGSMRGVRQMITYCEVGVRAATMALLHEIATGTVVPVFDGSLMEWGLDPEVPVDTGSNRPR